MISVDTNILFPAFNADATQHTHAYQFLSSLADRDDVCIAEQVLMELYCLVRNPTIMENPATATQAGRLIHQLRQNPKWHLVDMVPGHKLMDTVWQKASSRLFPYRRLFDQRLATVLLHHGVTDFATCNLKDFKNAGFVNVWNPL